MRTHQSSRSRGGRPARTQQGRASQQSSLTPVPIPSLQRSVAPAEQEKEKAAALRAAEPETSSAQEEELPVQAKSEEEIPVGAENAPAEKEADETAARVMRQVEPSKPAEEEEVQAKKEGGDAPKQEEEVSAIRRSPAAGASSTTLSRGALDQAGQGSPLAPGLQSYMEPRFGRDFSQVRVHDNQASQEAAKSIQAKAFTYGNDIYLGSSATQSDYSLMAHELTHVVQQGGAPSAAQPIRRTTGEGSTGTASGGASGGGDTAATAPPAGTEIEIPELKVPAFKLQGHRQSFYSGSLVRPSGYDREDNNQRSVWVREVRKAGTVKNQLRSMTATALGKQDSELNARSPYVFETQSSGPIAGTFNQVEKQLALTPWDRTGAVHSFDVDHIKELQLGGTNTLDNMELLDSSLNRSSGSRVKNYINEAVDSYLENHPEFGDRESMKRDYPLKFTSVVSDGGASAGDADFWRPSEIGSGAQLTQNGVNFVTAANPSAMGGDGKVVVLPTGGSVGKSMEFSWSDSDAGELAPSGAEAQWMKPYLVTAKSFRTGADQTNDNNFGVLKFQLDQNDPNWTSPEPTAEISLTRFPGARYAGYASLSGMRRKLSRMKSKHLSPIEVDDFGVGEGGIVASGRILPEIDFLQGGIDFLFQGGEVTVSKTFQPGNFSLPSPFEIRGTSLTISLGTASGLSAEGQVDFGIEGVGDGNLTASVSTANGMEFAGTFNFDTELFSRAEVQMGYRKGGAEGTGGFWASGNLAIEQGKVRGLKRASLTVGYSEQLGLTASGSGEADFPGVQGGDFSLAMPPGGGMELRAGLDLSPDIPRVTNGRVDVTVKKEGSAWSVGAGGRATLDLPGVPVTLNARYLDGVFDMSATVPYERGMLSGSLTAGVTNQAIGEDGQPTGGAADQMAIYGSGSMTVQIAPWLQATAGVTVQPDGNLKVRGELGIPGTLDLFPRKQVEKELFQSPPIDIPIFGASVAGTRVGIFATISGGMRAQAGIGPGQLQELRGGIEYEPANEQNTHVYATGKFVVPVDAGLTMFVRGGIGAGLAIVSVTGGLEAAGTLGIEGALEMSANVDWRPNTGIEFNGQADIWAQPSLTFDLNAYVNAEASLVFTTISLYENRWNLASVSVGSDYRVGVHFPVEYKEGEAFDVSLDDVSFTYPQIDVGNTIKGLLG